LYLQIRHGPGFTGKGGSSVASRRSRLISSFISASSISSIQRMISTGSSAALPPRAASAGRPRGLLHHPRQHRRGVTPVARRHRRLQPKLLQRPHRPGHDARQRGGAGPLAQRLTGGGVRGERQPAWVAITVTASIVWSASRGSSTPSLSRPPCTTSCQAVAGASAGGRGSVSTMSRKSCGGMV
jgi:hypothetical protein